MQPALLLAIHDRHLAQHGGPSGLGEPGLLESALARPQQLHAYGSPAPDLADLAASPATSLARNQPFADGNKRTAAVACESFPDLHGAALRATDVEVVPVYLALAEGELGDKEFAASLRTRIRRRGRGEVREPWARWTSGRRGPRARVSGGRLA